MIPPIPSADPSRLPKARWGILGTGRISRKFAEALLGLPEAELVAVGSRTRSAAAAFADTYRVRNVHENYLDLARDPEVDLIYIGTPHPFHCENTLLCLEGGKSVLVEKPFALNEREARQMVEAARRTKRFLMEAMWSHFLPALSRFFELVRGGAVGEPRMLLADFGFKAPSDPEGRLFNLALGGGSLLDVGVYPVSLATRIFGEPARVQSSAVMGQTGVDEQAAMILEYEGGAQAVLSSSVRAEMSHAAVLSGSEGRLRIEPPFWKGRRLSHLTRGQEEILDLPYEENGFGYEAREVMRCVREGLPESPRMSLEFSLSVIRTLDRIREGWDLRYPGE